MCDIGPGSGDNSELVIVGSTKRFEDLECRREARNFVGMVDGLVSKDRFRKDYDLASQVKRSAVSAMANIAEGFHRRGNREFIKFLDCSRSSLAETLSRLHAASDLQYIEEAEMNTLRRQTDLVRKQVNNLMTYLHQTNRPTN